MSAAFAPPMLLHPVAQVGWTSWTIHWSTVIGLAVLGALAVAGDEPQLASRIIEEGRYTSATAYIQPIQASVEAVDELTDHRQALIALLLVLNGFFAGTEMAIITARRGRMRARAQAGDRRHHHASPVGRLDDQALHPQADQAKDLGLGVQGDDAGGADVDTLAVEVAAVQVLGSLGEADPVQGLVGVLRRELAPLDRAADAEAAGVDQLAGELLRLDQLRPEPSEVPADRQSHLFDEAEG